MPKKIYPQSLEAEKAVLGAIIINPNNMQACYESNLTISDFYLQQHQLLFRVMLDMYNDNVPCDYTSLVARLKDEKLMTKIGETDYLSQLTDSVVSYRNIEHYITMIQDKSLLRELIDISYKTIDNSLENSYEPIEVMDTAEQDILKITRSRRAGNFRNTAEVVKNVYKHTMFLKENKNNKTTTGIATGFGHLDNVTHGFQNGDLIILAARPSVGKTAFALNLAANAAAINKKNVAFFSLEMPAESLLMRILAFRGNLDIGRLRNGNLNREEIIQLKEAVSRTKDIQLYIDDSASLRISDLFSKCRKLHNEKGLGIIIVDYLQLLSGSKNIESRLQEVSEISRGLKALARDLDVPVIALSQLSRGIEHRKDGSKPMLSDLRESGSIEQDADVVMFLSKSEEIDFEDLEQRILLSIAKHRNGALAEINLMLTRNTNKFSPIVD